MAEEQEQSRFDAGQERDGNVGRRRAKLNGYAAEVVAIAQSHPEGIRASGVQDELRRSDSIARSRHELGRAHIAAGGRRKPPSRPRTRAKAPA